MTEIRSTLDIIMEKTKNLSMSEEEKKELRRREWERKIKGWVQKYLDNLINLEALEKELKKEGKERYPQLQEILKMETLSRIEPDTDNSPLFQILEDILNISKKPFEKAINRFQEEIAIERQNELKNIKRRLAQMGISGSAVISNLDESDQWNACCLKKRENFKKEIMSLNK